MNNQESNLLEDFNFGLYTDSFDKISEWDTLSKDFYIEEEKFLYLEKPFKNFKKEEKNTSSSNLILILKNDETFLNRVIEENERIQYNNSQITNPSSNDLLTGNKSNNSEYSSTTSKLKPFFINKNFKEDKKLEEKKKIFPVKDKYLSKVVLINKKRKRNSDSNTIGSETSQIITSTSYKSTTDKNEFIKTNSPFNPNYESNNTSLNDKYSDLIKSNLIEAIKKIYYKKKLNKRSINTKTAVLKVKSKKIEVSQKMLQPDAIYKKINKWIRKFLYNLVKYFIESDEKLTVDNKKFYKKIFMLDNLSDIVSIKVLKKLHKTTLEEIYIYGNSKYRFEEKNSRNSNKVIVDYNIRCLVEKRNLLNKLFSKSNLSFNLSEITIDQIYKILYNTDIIEIEALELKETYNNEKYDNTVHDEIKKRLETLKLVGNKKYEKK